ncbi:tyrosine-type recombinase/integrase [Gordonia rubripertincta]|uniref:tyrosine-type recombinase/integrase n=1 Tax=Gordonia rubripertincta TaxID=36822 RepID=UPI0015F95AED|nr:tyrosine-type recombinase/integrase [Gordonia rubripertincta]QMU22086.1 tyrosine-type recombinase/integrase [Gordonia rubripertincta]
MSHATEACALARADLDLYIESFLARWESTNTRATYRQDLTAWLRWCDLHDKHPISDASRPLVEVWMRWLRDERGNSSSTINHRVGTLSQFFELALDDDLVRKNPCRLVRRPRAMPDADERIALTRDEMQRLTAASAASGPADHALIVLMGMCGLRVSEACGLDVTDCHEIAKAHRCVRFVGKGNKPALVPMPPAVQRAVDAAIGDRTEGPLIVRRDGSRMTRRSADRVVKRCAKAAGITAVTVSPHTLRHTFIVGALDAGASPRTVQLSARHADISTTLSTYDRGRQALDDHASYVVAGYFGSAA